jgi:hypothetical protein
MNNPDSKKIDIQNQDGLELLKVKAKYYGHYAEQLKVLELIEEIERLKEIVDGRDWKE